jgi:hypothetical protein
VKRLVQFSLAFSGTDVFVNPDRVAFIDDCGAANGTTIHFSALEDDCIVVKGAPEEVREMLWCARER